MDRAGVQGVLRAIGHTSQLKQDGQWVMTSCPLAPWLHGSGTDNSPSFGVHLDDTGRSIFHCFSCHKKGPLSYLLSLMERYTGDSYKELKDEIDKNEMFMGVLEDWDLATKKKAQRPLEPLHEAALRAYPEIPVDHPYLVRRDITNAEAIRKMELRLDTDMHGVERVLFPVRGVDGELYGLTGRAIDPAATPRIRDYANLPKERLLLGSHLVTLGKPIMVVEGLFAYATMVNYGFPAVALLGSEITENKARLLLEMACPLYLFLDNDTAGRKGTDTLVNKLGGYLPLFGVSYPPCEIIDGKPLISDPNDLYKNEITDMIDAAIVL